MSLHNELVLVRNLLTWTQRGFKMAILYVIYVMKLNEMEYVLIQTAFLTLEEAKLNDVNVSCS